MIHQAGQTLARLLAGRGTRYGWKATQYRLDGWSAEDGGGWTAALVTWFYEAPDPWLPWRLTLEGVPGEPRWFSSPEEARAAGLKALGGPLVDR